MSNAFNFTVEVPADEWAYCQRRMSFLEAMLLHVSREGRDMQEWFNAGELAAMRLPGLPAKSALISRHANSRQWPRRRIGRHVLYHVTSLPARAFDALLSRLLDLQDVTWEVEPAPVVDLAAEQPDAPPWVLPLMTLLRGSAEGDIARAWRSLPAHLPQGIVLPSAEEAATVLVDLGLADKMTSWKMH